MGNYSVNPNLLTPDLNPFKVAAVPPAYTRLEPQSVTGDPAPGVEAAVHDPLWLLLRQWQFGEFVGDDAGQPLAVAMTSTSVPVTAMASGDVTGATSADWLDERRLLDPLFEYEEPGDPGTRARAEAAMVLLDMLAEVDPVVPDLLKEHAFTDADVAAAEGLAPLIARVPDAARIAEAIESGAVPAWLQGAATGRMNAVKRWLDWYRANVAPRATNPAWLRERLEYRFAVATGTGPKQRVFKTPMHLGGEIDWYGFDLASGATLNPVGAPPAPPPVTARPAPPPAVLAAPLRFAGMPSDRLFEFEDEQVSFGAMNVQANDPARLCLIEFATVFSNDWFIVPLDTGAAAFTTVDSLSVTDSFGFTTAVPRANDAGLAGRFRLFETSSAGDASVPGILTLPTARHTIEGDPVETVHFLRDEAANMAWAIEHKVQAPTGLPRSRGDEAPVAVARPGLKGGAELRYILQTDVPRHWLPLVPVRTDGKGGFVLRKGTMTGTDEARGRLLASKPGKAVDVFDEEVPRGGLRVSRVPSLARQPDGTLSRWIAVRIGEGSGGGASHLASDATIDR